jgi:hypothetical protein
MQEACRWQNQSGAEHILEACRWQNQSGAEHILGRTCQRQTTIAYLISSRDFYLTLPIYKKRRKRRWRNIFGHYSQTFNVHEYFIEHFIIPIRYGGWV